MTVKNYRKFLAAAAGVFLALGQVLSDSTVSTAEWGLLATAVATAVGVVLLRNGDKPAEDAAPVDEPTP